MRHAVSAVSLVPVLALAAFLSGCDGCGGNQGMSAAERNAELARALSAPRPCPPSGRGAVDSIGHAVNVVPGQGPKRVESQSPRMGIALPILPGQGIDPSALARPNRPSSG